MSRAERRLFWTVMRFPCGQGSSAANPDQCGEKHEVELQEHAHGV